MNKQKIVIPLGIGLAAVLQVDTCPDWLNCGFDNLRIASLAFTCRVILV